MRRFFRWLRGLLAGPNPMAEPERLEDYATWQPPQDRFVFRYHDGLRWVNADPLRLLKRVLAARGSLALDIPKALSASPATLNAHTAAVKTIREVFEIKPLEEGGLNEVESVALMDAFMAYMGGLPPAEPTIGQPPQPQPPPKGESFADIDAIQKQLQTPAAPAEGGS